MKSEVYKIPAINVGYAIDKIKKINSRAAKMGVSPMKLTISEDIIEKREDFQTGKKYTYVFNEVFVEGEYPVINGWRIVGTIDHEGDTHLISIHGDFDVKRYREMSPVCEHCNQKKITVKSFLVEEVETGIIKAVGRGCLKNYINKDPKTMLAYLKWFKGITSEFDEDFISWGKPVIGVFEVMEIASMAIRNFGFVKSREEGSTGETIRMWLFDGKFRKENPVTDRDIEIADATYNSFTKSENDSEFNFLIKSLLEKGFVDYKWIPHLAGAVFGYTLKLATEAKRKTYKEGYVGEISKRMDVELTLESVKTIESYYGSTWIHNMVDAEGHKVTWFASNGDLQDKGIVVGVPFKAKVTPKKHEISNFDKAFTTTVNRLAVTKEK